LHGRYKANHCPIRFDRN